MEVPPTRPRTSRTSRNGAAGARKKVPTALLLKKKAECDAEALRIVERLTEPGVDVDWLKRNLARINKCHMEDAAEERFIVKLCGYVLCDDIPTRVSTGRYRISTLRNKVYDTSGIKNYCSYGCYRAAEFLMRQMLTGPLWLRDREEAPEFEILPKKNKNKRCESPPGVEIDLTGVRFPEDTFDAQDESETTKNEPVARTSRPEDESRNDRSEDERIESRPSTEKEEPGRCDEATTSLPNVPVAILRLSESPTRMVDDDSSVSPCKASSKRKSRREKATKSKEKTISRESPISRVEKSFGEWITPESLSLLYGEVAEKQNILENATREERYAVLCKKLDRLQLLEEREMASGRVNDSRPVPNFATLREQAAGLELKVKAFWQGKTTIETEAAESTGNTTPQPEATDVETFVPLTEFRAPNALRRRIFLDKLNGVLPDLLRTLAGSDRISLERYSYTAERSAMVRALVGTFSLSATNITFKTAEWTMIALLVVKLLAIMDPSIAKLLNGEQATKRVAMILMSYGLESNYLETLIALAKNQPNAVGVEENNGVVL